MSDSQDNEGKITDTQAIKRVDRLETAVDKLSESQIELNHSTTELNGKYKGLRTLAENTDKTVNKIHEAIQGDPMNGVKGMAQRLIDVEEALPEDLSKRMDDLEVPHKLKKRLWVAILIAIATGLGGFIFAKITGKI